MQLRLSRDSVLVWAVAPAICTVVVLWYQFGFTLGAMLEEWDVFNLMQQHPNFWSSFPGQLMSETFAARPLQILPHFIARQISRDSFIGFHFVLMAGCIMRIVGGALLGNYLFRCKSYAAAFGLLCLVYPADTQQFEFRTVHIVFSMGLMVFGSACTVIAITADTAAKRVVGLVVSMVFSIVAVLIYEPFITLYLLAPFTILSRDGFRSFFRLLMRRKLEVAGFLLAPIANGAYLFYTIVLFKSAYQVNSSGGSMSGAIAHNLHYLIDSAAYRVFYDAWVSTWWIVSEQIVHYRFVVVTGIAVLLGMLLLTQRGAAAKSASVRRTLRYVLSGVILVIVGYLPFMVAESHMVINQRTFMGVAPGASMIVIALIALIFRRTVIVGSMFAACFVFLGLIAQLYQFDRYTRDYTNVVLPYTSMIADQTDPSKPVHLIFDRTGFGGHLNGMYESKVQFAANVRDKGDFGTSVLCMEGVLNEQLPFSNCQLKDNAWLVKSSHGTTQRYPLEQVQVMTIGPDFDASYRSNRTVWRDYGHFVETASLFKRPDPRAYQCIADSMWGYSGFCRGEGWSDGVFVHDRFAHANFISALSTDPTFLFPLSPTGKNYALRMVVFGDIDLDMATHLKILINGAPVSVTAAGGDIRANVPTTMLKKGLNQIQVLNAVAPGNAAGLTLTRIDVAPVGSTQLAQMVRKYRKVPLDQWVSLNKSSAHDYLTSGFSTTEQTGVWTDGSAAEMTFLLPNGTSTATFVGEAIPFFSETHSHLNVSIDVNGRPVDEQRFAAPAGVETLHAPIHISDQATDQLVVIRFNFSSSVQPNEQDKRRLALFFTRFKVTK